MEMEWVLELRNPTLTAIFRGFTFLGDATFFLLFVPFGYWLWRTRLFARLGLLLLVSTMINVTLKSIFQVPRPTIPHLAPAEGWAFPSGHSQIAATIWIFLGLELGRRWLWPLLVTLIAGVAASRVYLGVHFPNDVIAGVAVGAVVAWIAWRLSRNPPSGWVQLSPRVKVAAAVTLIPVWAWLVHTTHDASLWQASGALMGFAIGILYQQLTVDFAVPQATWQKIGACLLGLAVVFGLRVGLKAVFADFSMAEEMADTCRYFVMTLWLTWFAPWCFVVLGLAGRRAAARPSPGGAS